MRLQPAIDSLSADTDESILMIVGAQPGASFPGPANGLTVSQSNCIGSVQSGFRQICHKAVRRQQQGIAGLGCQRFELCKGMGCSNIQDPYSGTAQAGQMCATAKEFTDVGSQGANIRTLAAKNLNHEASAGKIACIEQIQPVDTGPARGALKFDASTGIFIERLAIPLQRRIHWRNLVDFAGMGRKRLLYRPPVNFYRTAPQYFALGIRSIRGDAKLNHRHIALVGVQQIT